MFPDQLTQNLFAIAERPIAQVLVAGEEDIEREVDNVRGQAVRAQRFLQSAEVGLAVGAENTKLSVQVDVQQAGERGGRLARTVGPVHAVAGP